MRPLHAIGNQAYDFFMLRTNPCAIRIRYYRIRSICVAAFLCVCVLSLMLGTPISFASLLISAEILTESVSEGFSLPPIVPKPGVPGAYRIPVEFQPSLHLPVFVTSVFHPPQS